MKAAELFVQCLEQQGIEYVFGVPGEENIDLLDAFTQSSIKFIVCRHETGAAFIAGVMGKLTGNPGVCLSTLGPGATNMVTGVACATLDRMPLIAITAQTDLSKQKKGSHQYLNLSELYRPITKSSFSIKDGAMIPETIAQSFSLASAGLAGAVHIELPNDVASSLTQGEPIREVQPNKNEFATEEVIKDVALAINQAIRPLVFIGYNAASDALSTAILPFIEKLQVPVTETFMAKGVVPGNHPLHLQTIGLPEGDFVNSAFDLADLVITIGFDSIEYGAKKWNPSLKPVIHINSMGPDKNNYYPVKAALIGDLTANLTRLNEHINQRESMDPLFLNLKNTITNDLAMNMTSNAYPIAPQKIIQDIQSVLSEDDLLISDVGAHKLWIGRQFAVGKPNTCIISNGLASMGMALPGAIGAKLVFPNKKVLAVCGDGAFVMSLPEFETAVRLKLPIVIMVWHDGRYGMIEWEEQNKLGRTSFIQFDNPDFVHLAKDFGASSYKVEKVDDLLGILQKSFLENGPVVIECAVDYTENFRLSERLKAFKAIIS